MTNGPLSTNITVSPSFINPISGNQCTGIQQVFQIIVNPTPVITPVNNYNVCANSTVNAINFISDVTNTQFPWTNNNTSIGIGASGVGNIPSFVGTNNTNAPITGDFNVNGTYTSNGVTCTSAAQNYSITVNPVPTVDYIANQTVCNNDNTDQIDFFGTVSGTAFSWFNSDITIGLDVNGTGNIPSFTGLNTTNGISVAQITVTPNSIINGVICIGSPDIFTITINPTPTVVSIANVTYCNGSSTNNIVFSGNISGADYNWANSNSSIGLAANGTGNILSFVTTNNTSTPIFSTITVIPVVINNGIPCSGNPEIFTITVNPTPTVVDPDDQVICNEEQVSAVVFSGSTPNTVFNWQNDYPSIGLAASGIGNIPSFNANNILTATVTATITVTPFYTNSTTCQGLSQSFTVSVNPTPTVVDPDDQVICNGSNTNIISFNGNVNGTVYTWSNTNTSIGLPALGTGDILGFASTNTGNTAITSTITVIPYYTYLGVECEGTSNDFTITVNPTPSLNDPVDQVICNGSNTNLVNFNGNVFGTVYTWINNNNTIGLNSNGVGNINPFTALNLNATPVTADVTVNTTYANQGVTCIGGSQVFTITVNPLSILTNQPISICSNQNTNINLNANLTTPSITWQATNNVFVQGETFAPPQNTFFINDLLINNTTTAQIVNYNISLTNTFGCSSNIIFPITVNPLPVVQFLISNSPPCHLDYVNFLNNTTGSNNYNWDFGDGTSSNIPNPSHLYSAFGDYNVTLTATNTETLCSNGITQIVSVFESPTVGFDVSSIIGCEELEVTFYDTINNLNTSLQWDFGDGQTSNQSNFIDHQYNSTGCFDVTLTVTMNGCVSTQIQQDMVCVYETPIANFITDYTSYLIDNAQVVFTNSSLFAETYLWTFGDEDSSSANNPIHNYDDVGEYLITLFAVNSGGCYDSMMVTINVVNDLIIYVPNTITVDQDGINEVFYPVLGEAFLKDTYHLTIYNRWGEVVFESYNYEIGWDGSYAGHKAQQGTYIWQIEFSDLESTKYTKNGHVSVIR